MKEVTDVQEKRVDKESLLRLIKALRESRQSAQTRLYEYADGVACLKGRSLEAVLSRITKGDKGEAVLNAGLEKLEPYGLEYEWNPRTANKPDFQTWAPLRADIEAKDWNTNYRKTTNHVKKNILNKRWRRGVVRIAAFMRDPLLQGKTLYLLERARVHILTFGELLSLLETLLIPPHSPK